MGLFLNIFEMFIGFDGELKVTAHCHYCHALWNTSSDKTIEKLKATPEQKDKLRFSYNKRLDYIKKCIIGLDLALAETIANIENKKSEYIKEQETLLNKINESWGFGEQE